MNKVDVLKQIRGIIDAAEKKLDVMYSPSVVFSSFNTALLHMKKRIQCEEKNRAKQYELLGVIDWIHVKSTAKNSVFEMRYELCKVKRGLPSLV